MRGVTRRGGGDEGGWRRESSNFNWRDAEEIAKQERRFQMRGLRGGHQATLERRQRSSIEREKKEAIHSSFLFNLEILSVVKVVIVSAGVVQFNNNGGADIVKMGAVVRMS